MVAPVVKALTDLLMSWAASDEVDEEHLRLPIPQNCHEDCSSFGFLTSPSVLTHFGLPIDIMRVGENAERPWSEEDQKAIGAYLTHLYRLYRKDHHKYASAFEGADASPQAQGLRAWRLKITAAWNNVDGTRKLKAVLKAHGLDLDTLVMMHAVLPDTTGLGWATHSKEIAFAVFGEDALPSPDAPSIRPAVATFVQWQLTRLRQYWKTLHVKRRKELTKKTDDLKKRMKDAESKPETFTRSTLVALLKAVHAVHETAKRGGFRKEVATMERWKENFQDIAAFFLASPDGKAVRIPSQLEAALKHLISSQSDKRALAKIMEDAIEEHDLINTSYTGAEGDIAGEEGVDARGPLADITQWACGVSEATLNDTSIGRLYSNYLGVSDGRIPGLFPDMLSGPAACGDRWEDPNALTDSELVPLNLSHRQVVGIVQMLLNAFKARPIINNDDVGVGKTFQVLGFIAVLSWFHTYRKRTGHFPGLYFKDMVWPQDRDAGSIISGQPADSGVRDGNVPSRSCLITVPVPLLSMWIDEAHKLLQPTHFAIIPYETQSREVSATTWDQLYTSAVGKCNGNPLAVIVIATTKAVHNDFTSTYTKPPTHNGRYVQCGTSRVRATVYGRLWAATFYDEAHLARHNNGYSFHMHRALSYLSGFPCALTATPVMTTPADVGELARIVLAPEFEGRRGDALLAEFKKEERVARKAVTDAAKGQGEEPVLWKEALRRNGLASGDILSDESRRLIEILETQCGQLRARLHKYIIRRENVFDPDTMQASERHRFPPKPIIIDILVNMFPEELKAINAAYTSAANEGHRGAKNKPSSGFYIRLRQLLTHYLLRSKPKFPRTIEEWNAAPGAKLDTVVDIIQHHLARDHAPPLMPNPMSSIAPARAPTEPLVPNPGHAAYTKDTVPPATPDKIVVFSQWVNLYPLILRRFKLAGIEALSLTGKESTTEKKKILLQFFSSDKARVLLVSTVALNGLNLQHACILIVLDVLWSAQEVTQLLGRLVRQGQLKVVIAYHIIANGTTDIALNNISFDKRSMHQGYTRIPAALEKIIEDASDAEESPLQPEEDNLVRTEKTTRHQGQTGKRAVLEASRIPAAAASSGIGGAQTRIVSPLPIPVPVLRAQPPTTSPLPAESAQPVESQAAPAAQVLTSTALQVAHPPQPRSTQRIPRQSFATRGGPELKSRPAVVPPKVDLQLTSSPTTPDGSGPDEGTDLPDLEDMPPSSDEDSIGGALDIPDVVTSRKSKSSTSSSSREPPHFSSPTATTDSSGDEPQLLSAQRPSHPLRPRSGTIRPTSQRHPSIGLELSTMSLSSDDDMEASSSQVNAFTLSAARSRSGTIQSLTLRAHRAPPTAIAEEPPFSQDVNMTPEVTSPRQPAAFPSLSPPPTAPKVDKGKRVERLGLSRASNASGNSVSGAADYTEVPDHDYADTESSGSTSETGSKRRRSGSDAVLGPKKSRKMQGQDAYRAEATVNRPLFLTSDTKATRPRRPPTNLSWKAAAAASTIPQPTPRLASKRDAQSKPVDHAAPSGDPTR